MKRIVITKTPYSHPVDRCPDCGSTMKLVANVESEILLWVCTREPTEDDEWCEDGGSLYVMSEDISVEFEQGLPNSPDLDEYQGSGD